MVTTLSMYRKEEFIKKLWDSLEYRKIVEKSEKKPVLRLLK